MRNVLVENIKKLASEKKYSRKEISEKVGISIHQLDYIIKKNDDINLYYNCGQTHKTVDWEKERQNIINLIRSGKTREQVARHIGVAYATLCAFIINECPDDLRVYYTWTDEEISSLKALYKEGEYRHDVAETSGRTSRAIKYAVKKYVNFKKVITPINPISGGDSPSAKFSNKAVDKIRANFKNGGYSSLSYAAEVYGVSRDTMRKILTYKTYIRHLNVNMEKIIELREEMKQVIKRSR